MSKYNIHAGITNDVTRTRLIVVWKQMPENPGMALVIKTDSLVREAERDRILELSLSQEAQNEKDFMNILHKKGLDKLYFDNKIYTALPIDQILMTPGDGRTIPLREVINQMNKMNGAAPLPDPSLMENISSANPYASQMKEDITQDSNRMGVARNILTQARLSQLDVNKMINKAFAMEPSLKQEWNRMFPSDNSQISYESFSNEPEVEFKSTKKTKIKKKKKSVTKQQNVA